ncbi:hypothetical protein O181_016019 [Austropuccinia psidii MF-1]|uniref:Uncharacterized protein n=1 Tax=Austropuccinia psidii MF-1 TaxID=1389203 RepID=A0A9Q3GRD8_9BASI|nr:hypothetical protein [Austropuccinia psidii MF-1]
MVMMRLSFSTEELNIRYTVFNETTPTSTPPLFSIPIPNFQEYYLVQSALASFIYRYLTHPPIFSLPYINSIHGPTSSKIESIFGDPLAPLVSSPHFPSPALNPPPPCNSQPASSQVLQFQWEE